jgi:hypothetical protein
MKVVAVDRRRAPRGGAPGWDRADKAARRTRASMGESRRGENGPPNAPMPVGPFEFSEPGRMDAATGENRRRIGAA